MLLFFFRGQDGGGGPAPENAYQWLEYTAPQRKPDFKAKQRNPEFRAPERKPDYQPPKR